MADINLMICGHGRHGKNVVADYLTDRCGFRQWDSSRLGIELAVMEEDRRRGSEWVGLEFARACDYNDEQIKSFNKFQGSGDDESLLDLLHKNRHQGNGRQFLYEAICEYNKFDKCRLMRELYARANIYVGIRDREEFLQGERENLFQLSIWVDAFGRVNYRDQTCKVLRTDCDIIILNNTEPGDLFKRLSRLGALLDLYA